MATKYKLKEDREQGNKEIAAFLGGTVYTSYTFGDKSVYGWKGKVVEKYRELVKLAGLNVIMTSQLEFDTDWNALMWVVETIEERGFHVIKGFNNSFVIGQTEKRKAEILVESTDRVAETINGSFRGYTKVPDTTIDALWWCILKFIRWKNLNESQDLTL